MEKPIQVLFMDDEENILKSLTRLFMLEPYGIVTTSEAEVALQAIEQRQIKVVVSDYRMPNTNGVEFLQKVKEKYPDRVRILFTGYADVEAAEDAVNVGEVYRFISKPWNAEELKEIIRKAIKHYDLVLENQRLFEESKTRNIELQQLNNQLMAMFEKQKEFNSTVSHELRTPLASMKMALDIILSGSAGPLTADQTDFLTRAKNNVDRLNRLINDVLDLSKLESSNLKLKIESNDLNEIIKDTTETQKLVAQKKGLGFNADLDAAIPKIPCDKDKLHQVITNLVSNAIKFTPQGEITVSTKLFKEANHVEVRVKDTGPGIAEEDLPRLFQKFQQLEAKEKRVDGTGLGLAICKEIIKNHGGKIWAESKLGEGSQFCFNLPVEERRTSK